MVVGTLDFTPPPSLEKPKASKVKRKSKSAKLRPSSPKIEIPGKRPATSSDEMDLGVPLAPPSTLGVPPPLSHPAKVPTTVRKKVKHTKAESAGAATASTASPAPHGESSSLGEGIRPRLPDSLANSGISPRSTSAPTSTTSLISSVAAEFADPTHTKLARTSVPTLQNSSLRRVPNTRSSQVWQSFDSHDFESELASEFESSWPAGGVAEGSILLQTINNACKRIWTRPISKMCLHSDLPRLSLHLELVDERTASIVRPFSPSQY